MSNTSVSKTYYRSLKAVLTGMSALRFVIPQLNTFYEEEVMNFWEHFDWLLLFWVPVLNIFGNWIKKKKLPAWVSPTPILILYASWVICAIAGCLKFKGQIGPSLVTYALFNGACITLLAIGVYDTVRDLLNGQFPWIKNTFGKIIAKIKAKKEEKSEKV